MQELQLQDRNKAFFLYDNNGGSDSAQIRDRMASLGFKTIYNMLGGMAAWKAAGYPTVPGTP
jgi:rhodanese-related sulfurtransferase